MGNSPSPRRHPAPPLQPGDVLDLTLTEDAYGGDAIGRDPQGRPVFVPYAVPGEEVTVRITRARSTWASGRLVEVRKPSSARVVPRCRHFMRCGGCHYQHMSYPAQLEAKTEILRRQLQRLAGMADPPLAPIVASADPWNYRNHLQFTLTSGGRLAYQAAATRELVPIDECYLPEPALADLWPRLDFGPDSPVDRVSIRAGSRGETVVALQGRGEPAAELETSAEASVVWMGQRGPMILAGDGRLEFTVSGRSFQVSPDSFFQVHTALIQALADRVLMAVSPQPAEIVFDLYAGVGLFSAFLAAAGARVIAVEESPSACADFEHNLADLDVELYNAAVEQALPSLPRPAAVVVDPPRTGLSRPALEALVAQAPPRLIYVSCDPSTLARDARRLGQAGYRLDHITPIDLFPQTYHIESVSRWTRQNEGTPASLR